MNLDTEKILMLDFYGGNWQVFLAQAPLAVEAGLATVYHFCPQESTNFIILLMTFLLLWQKLKWQLISNSIYKCLAFDLEKYLPIGYSPAMFMVGFMSSSSSLYSSSFPFQSRVLGYSSISNRLAKVV